MNDSTFAFLEGVLSGARPLPGPVVHVGGDEVPVVQWEQSADAQARMAELRDHGRAPAETYFTNRIAVLTGRGCRWIG